MACSKNPHAIRFFCLLIAFTLACALPIANTGTPAENLTSPNQVNATLKPPITASAAAGFTLNVAVYLDTNHDQQLAPADPPLADCTVNVTDAQGKSSTPQQTDANGQASLWYPEPLIFPVTVSIVPAASQDPKKKTLEGTEKVLDAVPNGTVAFLLSPVLGGPSLMPSKKCGDGICTGPENAQICPQDCANGDGTSQQTPPPGATQGVPATDPITNPTLVPAAEPNTYWVVNPGSKSRLYVQVFHPKDWKADPLPTLILVPGGIADSSGFTGAPGKAQRIADAGFTVIVFDADGRGKSGGKEDYNGFIQQDGLAAVIQAASSIPGVAMDQRAVVSYSYGITMASGALARHPEVGAKFLIDWEGPANRDDTTTGCKGNGENTRIQWPPCSDDAAWAQREAVNFIGKVGLPYQRIQSATDHVQPDISNAVDMINAAVQGGLPWVRLNDLAPNQTYTLETVPTMPADTIDRQIEQLVAKYAKELFNP